MKQPPGPLVEFDCYPEAKDRKRKNGIRVTVLIYRCNKHLVAHYRSTFGVRPPHKCLDGFVKKLDGKPWAAVVYLSAHLLYDNVVSHELLHAAFFWAQCKGFTPRQIWPCGIRHERFCYAYDRLVCEFWRQFFRHHLYGESWYWAKTKARPRKAVL